MSLISLFLGIVLIAVLVFITNYFLAHFIPGSAIFQQLVIAIGFIVAILFILRAFGILPALNSVTVPQVR